jgi:hypothetical protein
MKITLVSFDRESDGCVELVRHHPAAHFGHHRGARVDHRRAAHLLRHDADAQVEEASSRALLQVQRLDGPAGPAADPRRHQLAAGHDRHDHQRIRIRQVP